MRDPPCNGQSEATPSYILLFQPTTPARALPPKNTQPLSLSFKKKRGKGHKAGCRRLDAHLNQNAACIARCCVASHQIHGQTLAAQNMCRKSCVKFGKDAPGEETGLIQAMLGKAKSPSCKDPLLKLMLLMSSALAHRPIYLTNYPSMHLFIYLPTMSLCIVPIRHTLWFFSTKMVDVASLFGVAPPKNPNPWPPT